MRIDPAEFRALNLRVNALLHDVPLEDAWSIPLSGGGDGRTIQDVRALMAEGRGNAPAAVKALFALRHYVGNLLGWDDRAAVREGASFADRLTVEDRAASLDTPGTAHGSFNILYRFEHEQLAEIRNATVLAFSSLSIRPVPGGYLLYLGVFVQPVHRFTRLYMALIAPFRRVIVYPALIRQVQSAWAKRYGVPPRQRVNQK